MSVKDIVEQLEKERKKPTYKDADPNKEMLKAARPWLYYKREKIHGKRERIPLSKIEIMKVGCT